MKTSTKVIIGLSIVVGAAVWWLPEPLSKMFLLRELRRATGVEVTYDRFHSQPWQRVLEVDGLVFRNPPAFKEPVALEIRRLHARYQWRQLLSDRVELDELSLDVPRVVLVRLADGSTNLEQLQSSATSRSAISAPAAPAAPAPAKDEWAAALAATAEAAPASPPPPAPGTAASRPAPAAPAARAKAPPPAAEPDLHIGRLRLQVAKVELVDYGRMKKGKPYTHTYDVNVDQTFENVTDLDAVGQQLAARVLVQEGVRAVADQLSDPETMEKLNKNLDKLAEKLGEFLK